MVNSIPNCPVQVLLVFSQTHIHTYTHMHAHPYTLVFFSLDQITQLLEMNFMDYRSLKTSCLKEWMNSRARPILRTEYGASLVLGRKSSRRFKGEANSGQREPPEWDTLLRAHTCGDGHLCAFLLENLRGNPMNWASSPSGVIPVTYSHLSSKVWPSCAASSDRVAGHTSLWVSASLSHPRGSRPLSLPRLMAQECQAVTITEVHRGFKDRTQSLKRQTGGRL